MEEWDLQAVVRGCNGVVEAAAISPGNFEHLRVAEQRFLLADGNTVPQESKSTQNREKQPAVSDVIKSKKSKKYLQKRVVEQMNEAGLSADKWAWRKYGQKPIKGSPFPRSYYRCSSSKGCLARKQLERSPLNPEIFIVTFTNEHSHELPSRRNSLAGSTRIKPTVPKSSVKEESQAPSVTSLDSDHLAHQRSGEQSDSDKIGRDFDVLSSDMMLRDEFLMGWDDLEEILTSKEFSFDDCFFD